MGVFDDENLFSEENLVPVEEGQNLPAVNIESLNEKSLEILNQLIAESNAEKVKDLTYLFNLNQNKKTLARIDKLSTLQDLLVSQFSERLRERPDEISNQELMNALKTVQDILERGQKQTTEVAEAPLIQINQQTNSVNLDSQDFNGLSRDSREKVKRFMSQIIQGIASDPTNPIDMTDPSNGGKNE